MSGKDEFILWLKQRQFSFYNNKSMTIAKREITLKNEIKMINVIFDNGSLVMCNLELYTRKNDNKSKYVLILKTYILYTKWESAIKKILTKSKLKGVIAMAKKVLEKVEDAKVVSITDNQKIDVETAKKVLQEEQEKIQNEMQNCANEIGEILNKYNFDLTTVVSAKDILEMTQTLLNDREKNAFILAPSLRVRENLNQ